MTATTLPTITSEKAVTESSFTDSWTSGIGSHFAQMADAFAKSITDKNINEYRVRFEYNAATESVIAKVCPKLSEDQMCARQSTENECWPVGSRNSCTSGVFSKESKCEIRSYTQEFKEPTVKMRAGTMQII